MAESMSRREQYMEQAHAEDGKCTFFLEGRIVQENAKSLERELHNLLEVLPEQDHILDALRLDYISSKGLRTLLELIRKNAGKLTIRNASEAVYSTLETAGITDLVNVEAPFEGAPPNDSTHRPEARRRTKALRSVATDSSKIIGMGRSSVVYLLDSETLVKKYDVLVPIEKIYQEMDRARSAFVYGIPDRNTMVHCDFHENNVLVTGDDLVLIDMVDVGHGHPVFDLAGGAFRAHVSLIPGRHAHHGLSADTMQQFWKVVVSQYFGTDDPGELGEILDMCHAFGLVRSALFPMKHVHIGDNLKRIHIDDARRNLFPRQDWAFRQLENLERFFPDDSGQV